MKCLAIILLIVTISYAAGDDSRCHARSGTCQEDHLSCHGSYMSGLCAGHASRRCCVPVSTSTTSNDIDCTKGTRRYSATGTGYYPDSSAIEGGFVDMRDTPLGTLQDYLAGRSSIVTVAMDNHAGITYDTHICIPEMNHRYGRFIDFRIDMINCYVVISMKKTDSVDYPPHQDKFLVSCGMVRDTGSAFYHKGFSRIDICVRTASDSYDNSINGPLTLVFP